MNPEPVIDGPECLMDGIDRQIILATQSGLPLESQPYHAVARQVGISPKR